MRKRGVSHTQPTCIHNYICRTVWFNPLGITFFKDYELKHETSEQIRSYLNSPCLTWGTLSQKNCRQAPSLGSLSNNNTQSDRPSPILAALVFSLAIMNNPESSDSHKKYTCPVNGCGKSFQRKEHLTRHERAHNPETLFVCKVCKRKFNRRFESLSVFVYEGIFTYTSEFKTSIK